MSKVLKEIVLAGGCFWGVEEYIRHIDGVEDTQAVYANGRDKHPTYEKVCRQDTGFVEAVYVRYNPKQVSLKTLIERFFRIIDPLSLNRQGNDVGSQYRTGVYYIDKADLPVLKEVFEIEQGKHTKKIVTELQMLENVYPAEEYHQKYLQKNPQGYCHINLDL